MIHRNEDATRNDTMALNIRNKETERLAAALAAETGETKTEAVRKALEERLVRARRARGKRGLLDEISEIADHCSALPLIDERTPEQILGYDDIGMSR